MNLTEADLKALLVIPGFVSAKVFADLVKLAEHDVLPITQIILEKGLIQEDQLVRLIADKSHFPYVDLNEVSLDPETVTQLPEQMARLQKVIAYKQTEKEVHLAMQAPDDLDLIALVAKKFGKEVVAHIATSSSLKRGLVVYTQNLYSEIQSMVKAFENHQMSPEKRDQLVVEVFDKWLIYGLRSEASDFHIEPQNDQILVRFRIDGVMHDLMDLPVALGKLLVARIKILAKLRTDEHAMAQDGKFHFQTNDDEAVDVRVSIVPVTKGENVVMRLLTSNVKNLTMVNLGMTVEDLKKLQQGSSSSNGMILVSGPTGGGKTTTVYAIMRSLNTREVHISTIEDPVEYEINGISQIQVNPQTNLTFAEGLRAIVRQDPDIILVGEIRDVETAGIAVNAAMTGHLVLSTMHANDAVTTLVRMIEIGVEPFLVASSVNVVVAQRLVRKICNACRTSCDFNKSKEDLSEGFEQLITQLQTWVTEVEWQSLQKARLYYGKGCELCKQTGFRGRVGVFEVLLMSDEVRQLVGQRATAKDLQQIARKQGMQTLFQDGLIKVRTGITTLSELLMNVQG